MEIYSFRHRNEGFLPLSGEVGGNEEKLPNRTAVCIALRTLVEECTVILSHCYAPRQVEETKRKQKQLMNLAIKKILPGLDLDKDCPSYQPDISRFAAKMPKIINTGQSLFHPLQFGLSTVEAPQSTAATADTSTAPSFGNDSFNTKSKANLNSILKTTAGPSASKIPFAFLHSSSPSTNDLNDVGSPIKTATITISMKELPLLNSPTDSSVTVVGAHKSKEGGNEISSKLPSTATARKTITIATETSIKTPANISADVLVDLALTNSTITSINVGTIFNENDSDTAATAATTIVAPTLQSVSATVRSPITNPGEIIDLERNVPNSTASPPILAEASLTVTPENVSTAPIVLPASTTTFRPALVSMSSITNGESDNNNDDFMRSEQQKHNDTSDQIIEATTNAWRELEEMLGANLTSENDQAVEILPSPIFEETTLRSIAIETKTSTTDVPSNFAVSTITPNMPEAPTTGRTNNPTQKTTTTISTTKSKSLIPTAGDEFSNEIQQRPLKSHPISGGSDMMKTTYPHSLLTTIMVLQYSLYLML